MATTQEFSIAGISARKRKLNRVRISIPNCDNVNLVMWVTCERDPDMIRFQIARGLSLLPTSHGLLGTSTGKYTRDN